MLMYRLNLLGRIELTDGDGRDHLDQLSQQKRLALLVYLAAERPARFHRRDTIVALFWPDLGKAEARSALRQAVYYLRSHLGQDAIVARGPEEIGINPEVLSTDLARFEEAIAASRWQEALALARGPLGPGLHCEGASPDFTSWLDRRRREIRRQASQLIRVPQPVEHQTDLAAATEQVRRAIDQGSFDEGLVRQLMHALVEDDNRAAALTLYKHFAQRLWHELEIEPSPRTRELADAIRRGES
ncbi:MAG TPA: BTAD domain-containing putative transcriptional regulator [Gemmatimonadales bacterium]|nr:BTAD domain-containing putative transcriptional regulator [Gemmatimonadales bacterium]